MVQRQQGGEQSSNVQAGGNITIHGLSVEEVREVALDVFQKNFLELRGIAEDVARGRAEKITEDFLAELEHRSPQGLQSASDPDMQRALFEAQREYACSGEADLEQALVDLLVDRAGQGDRGIQTIVLNEAIRSAPKLTAEQRRAVAVCFLMRYTRWMGPGDVEMFYALHVRQNLCPLASGLPTRPTAYQHIEYVGAGTIDIGEVAGATALLVGARRWFTRGFTREEIPEELTGYLQDTNVFIPCLRDNSRLQLAIVSEEDLDALLVSLGRPDLKTQLQHVLNLGVMSEQEAHTEIVERAPEMEELFHAWGASPLKNMTLTSVGIAIGHGYWRRVTGLQAPLSTWISD